MSFKACSLEEVVVVRISLNAMVRTHDGRDLGRLEGAVVNPETNEVEDFAVASSGIFGRDLLIPRQIVETAAEDGSAIRIRLSREEVERLPSYIPASYIPPPPEFTASGLYQMPRSAYMWPAAFRGGGTAWESGAGPNDLGPYGGMETAIKEVEDQRLSIGKGAHVFDLHGKHVGVVGDVLFDQRSGKISGFVLRVGPEEMSVVGLGKPVQIDVDKVGRVHPEGVYLTASTEEIQRMAGL